MILVLGDDEVAKRSVALRDRRAKRTKKILAWTNLLN